MGRFAWVPAHITFAWAAGLPRRGEHRRPCFVGHMFDTVRRNRQLRSGRGAVGLALYVTYCVISTIAMVVVSREGSLVSTWRMQANMIILID